MENDSKKNNERKSIMTIEKRKSDGAFIVSGHSGIDISSTGAIDNATIDGGTF